MFEENYYETISDFIKKSDFGEPRDYGYATFHAGDDYTSRRFKKQDVYNLIDGVCFKKGKAEFAGNYIILRHNFKHIGGIDENIFSCYKHLDSIAKFIKRNRLILHGYELGRMGNTGYCKTLENKTWRLLTVEEKSDPECVRGVHAHIEFYQKEKISLLRRELTNLGLIKNHTPDEYFSRKGKTYINPKIIIDYARLLLEKKNV